MNQMEKLIIRLAKEKDAEQLAQAHVHAWQYAYRGIMSDEFLDALSVEQRAKRWQKILTDPHNAAKNFVAEYAGKAIGFCSVGPCRDEDMDKNTGELWAINVDPQAMSHGAGSALMEKGLSYLREQGYTSAILWVATKNTKSRKWYEKRGWRVEGKEKIDDARQAVHETRYIIAL